MKRLIVFLAVVISVVLFASLIGCDPQNEVKETPEVTATKEPTPTPEPTEEPTPTPTPAPGTNVALNRPYEVSSDTGETHTVWGWHADYINDGITEVIDSEHCGWTTQVGIMKTEEEWEDQWVLIDIGGELKIDKVILYPIQNSASFFPVDYHVEVSTDKDKFETVVSVTDDLSAEEADDTPKELTFDAITARYVRVVFTKPYSVPSPADGYLVQLAEIEIYTAE